VRIMWKEILESCFGIGGCGRIRGAFSSRHQPDITDLILRISWDRLVWKCVDHSLVRFDWHLGQVLFLACEANVELSARCVFPVWRGADDVRENRYSPIQRVPKRDPQNFPLFASQIHFAYAKLRLDCFIEVWVTGISFDQLPI